jgi:hypothetical protein
MDGLLPVLAMYSAIAVVMVLASSWVLRRLGIEPSFARILACCVIATCLMSLVSTNVAMLLAARRARLERGDKAAEAPRSPVPIAEIRLANAPTTQEADSGLDENPVRSS